MPPHPRSQGHNGLGCKPHQGNLKVGRGRLAEVAPGSDLCSLRVSPRWELLGTRCGSGRVLDLSSQQTARRGKDTGTKSLISRG